MASLLLGRYAKAKTVILVCDHLATHTVGALHEALDPATARRVVKRIVFCQTPRQDSWLNVAECELVAMTKQCMAGRHFGTIAVLQREAAMWQ